MVIEILEYDFSICKVADYSQVDFDSEYFFIGNTDEEKSVVCLTSRAPHDTVERDDGWRAFRIQGVLDFSLVGVLSKISTLLAEDGIGIFAISTFNTDYILVKKHNLDKAVHVLTNAGIQVI